MQIVFMHARDLVWPIRTQELIGCHGNKAQIGSLGEVSVNELVVMATATLGKKLISPPSSPPHLHSTPLHSTPLHSTPLHSTPLHSTPLHSTPLHSTPLHSTPLHSTPLHSTPLHSAPLSLSLSVSTLR